MYQPVELYIGLRYMTGGAPNRFNRFISWLSTIGITLGVLALVTVLSVMNGFEHELESKILQFMPQVLLTTPQGRLDPKLLSAGTLSTLKGVTHISPLTTGDVLLQSACSLAIGVMLGVNPGDDDPLSHSLLKVQQNKLIAGQYKVILGSKLAEMLSVRCGDTLRLIVPSAIQFTPLGQIPSQRLFTVAGTFSTKSELDAYQLIVNQEDASRILRYPTGYISGWRLWLQKPLKIEQLNLQSLPKNFVSHDWRERKGELFQAMRMEKNMMSLFLSLIIAVAAFNIIISLTLLVIEKKKEVAILQTQGLTSWKVMLIFIVRGATAGIIGALFGTIGGVVLASQLNSLIPIFNVFFDQALLPVVIDPFQVIAIALSAMMVALLSTIYPSWQALSIHPAKALRYE